MLEYMVVNFHDEGHLDETSLKLENELDARARLRWTLVKIEFDVMTDDELGALIIYEREVE